MYCLRVNIVIVHVNVVIAEFTLYFEIFISGGIFI